MVKEQKDRKASMTLGILSICLFWLTWPGMILALIGLSIKKSEVSANRDWILNIIGLVLSTIYTIIIVSLLITI